MKCRTPEQAGLQPLGPLPPIGRAERWQLAEGELWRLRSDDPARASLRWGMARGIGPFVLAGEDEQGAWFVKRALPGTLAGWLKSAPEPLIGLRTFERLAQLLDACERKRIFPGPLLPDAVLIDEDQSQPVLAAEAWLHELVGASAAPLAAERHNLRFFPPEQASGAAWDESANRYAFGLMLYQLLAGEPAFAGQGLRLSLEARGQQTPAAFAAERARLLPPGLQSFVLRLLSPEPGDRPATARLISHELRRYTTLRTSAVAKASLRSEVSDQLPATPAGQPRRRVLPLSLLALFVGGLLCAVAFGVRQGARREPPPIGPRQALRGASAAADCASCHPRHADEWRGSVMAHSATSPLFQALEQLISEQIGRDSDCPDGAGVLRPAGGAVCRDRRSGLAVTGSGGEGWCSNCHLPSIQLTQGPPAFRALERRSPTHAPLAELVPRVALEGIACAVCHQAARPVRPGAARRGEYEGNPFWTSAQSGRRFDFRPEAARGQHGIANSGYELDPSIFLAEAARREQDLVPGGAHQRTPESARRYQRSSEFCGSCHDVRLFGTDVLGAARGEHFKRLRNGYSEWSDWARDRERRGLSAASCVDCHMSSFPGICVPDASAGSLDARCPPGTRFEARAPGTLPRGRTATNSATLTEQHPHFLSGVEVPLDPRLVDSRADDSLLDGAGLPLGARARRDLLLASALRLEIGRLSRRGARLSVPLIVENVGAGHRVPGGFSQERELWLHVAVRDGADRLIYEVGAVRRPTDDLADKRFLRVNSDDGLLDAQGRPIGLFGADVADGPDVPRWSPPPELGGRRFRGRGLVNFQNGFLRCVKCIGRLTGDGRCEALPGQESSRSARFDDAAYDLDTGECNSNLSGREALFEVFFPVGALDAGRGITKAPDAIIDTRALAPEQPVEYVYELDVGRAIGPFRVEARLLFRAFPPYLLRAFIDYERRQAQRGKRPSGPLIDERALERLDIVEIGRVSSAGGST